MRAWYAFYPKDFMIDTLHLNPDEECLYRRMIDLYYMNGGPLIFDEVYLGKSTRYHRTKLRHILPKVLPYFEVKNGFLHHKRIDAEIEKALKIQGVKAKAGRKGGRSSGKHMLDSETSICSSKPQPTTTSTHNTDISAEPESSDSDASAVQKPAQKAEKAPRETPAQKPINGHNHHRIPGMNYSAQQVVDLYNDMLPELLPIKKLTWRLEHDIRNIHNTTDIGCHEIKHWTNFFKRVKRSDWLTGRANGKPSRYSLRKLIESECYAKIAEGTYD